MPNLFFFRHGKSTKLPGQADFDRMLNDVGKEQAEYRRQKLDGLKFDLVLSSHAPRALTTAMIIADVAGSDIIPIRELYPDPNDDGKGKALNDLMDLPHLGYAPVSKYLKDPKGHLMSEYAEATWPILHSRIVQHGSPENIAIFGHAVLLPAIAMVICKATLLTKTIEDIDLGECEGFRVGMDANRGPFVVEQIRA